MAEIGGVSQVHLEHLGERDSAAVSDSPNTGQRTSAQNGRRSLMG